MEKNQQFQLRLRHGSDLDEFARFMLEGARTTEEIRKFAGSDWRVQFFTRVASNMDNMRLTSVKGKKQLVYMDPTPASPVSVGVDVNVRQSHADVESPVEVVKTSNDSKVEPMQWPQMPPVPESMGDIFCKPAFFDTMQTMVEIGRHISLEGAPGTGKDTAIQELAARNGKPLVTVGGDGGLRKRDLVGTTEIINGSTSFHVAEFAAAVVYGWWASITEINAADPDVLLLLNACMATPYIININGKAYPVHKDFRLFVSYNAGLIGAKPLPQSFKDRFFSIKVPFYNRTTLRSVLVAHGMPEIVDGKQQWTNTVVEFGLSMWSAYERVQMRYQASVRRLMDAVALMQAIHGIDVKEALNQGVLAAIDSPVELKAAKFILEQTI